MTRPAWPICLPILWVCLAVPLAAAEGPAANDPEAAKFFETRVRPVLVARCFECHGPESKHEGNLRVDSRAALLQGGDIGPAIKPGDPKASLLVDAINHGDVVQMPPKTRLPAREIADLTAWIAQGAPWPDAPDTSASRLAASTGLQITAEDRAFWAFRPVEEPDVPATVDKAWPQGALDCFVLEPLEARGLAPARRADKRTLIRRATFDLHGLPPTPAEVAAFLADESPGALARVIDRLLASPRYGERWGRRWLDIARYADSNGMDENMAMAHAWRYRDYVVAAFNRDTPYDQFVREQLAGDLLGPSDEATTFQRLVATGFLVLGPKMLAEDDPVKMEMDIIDEQVDTVGRAFMGLTLGCARCHDHKFDPVPTSDYYSLAGIFKSTKTMENYRVVAMWSERPLASGELIDKTRALDKQIADAAAKIRSLETAASERLLGEARGQLARYLLAAGERQRNESELSAVTADLAAGKLGDGAVLVEAENYSRGNVVRDHTTYGANIGVIYNAGQLPNFAEYDVLLPAAGTYRVALRYAAAESRPLQLSLDGRPLRSDAAAKTTGSWQPDTQSWSIEAVVPLAAGKHVIRLERGEPLPHVDKLALLPAHFVRDVASGNWRVAGQSADQADLNPALLDQWVAYLARCKSDGDSPLRVWHAWQQAEREGTSPRLDETDAVTASLLRAPRPGSLAALAERYEQICRESDAAGKEQRPPGQERPAAEQTTIQAFRKILVDPAGPFALPKNAERFYPEQDRDALAKLRQERASLATSKPELPMALAVDERAPQNLRVHIRGNALTQGDEVPRRFPRVLAGDAQPPLPAGGSGRLELAQWLTRPDHPLTARVMVNRIWQGHFGEGLVRTPDNFGRLGERPDNRPLLDWLARRFVESGWSTKAMHRTIMLSSAYAMSTAYDERSAAADPENRLLWRMNRRRLEAEEIRDAILATSGQLDLAPVGSLLASKNHTYVTSTASTNDVKYDVPCRSVYLPVVRSAVYEVFTAFDFADPSTMNGKRPSTTVAPQALFMMNSPLVLTQTRVLAEQLAARDELDDPARVNLVYERAYGRPASQEETGRALQFVERYRSEAAAEGVEQAEARLRAWQALARVILSSNEFIFLE